MTPTQQQALRRAADALREFAVALDALSASTGQASPGQAPQHSPAGPTARKFAEGLEPDTQIVAQHTPTRSAPTHQHTSAQRSHFDGTPTNGAAFFLWIKQLEGEHEVKLVAEITQWAKRKGWGHVMKNWTPEQVEQAAAEALRRLNGVIYA